MCNHEFFLRHALLTVFYLDNINIERIAAMAVSFHRTNRCYGCQFSSWPSHLLFETWDSHWISSLPLLLALTAYAATATTSCVRYVSSLALSLPLLLLLLSTSLSHLGLITAPHSTLVSLLCVWVASSALSALPHFSQEAFLELDTYLPTSFMQSTGCHSSRSADHIPYWCPGLLGLALENTSEIFAVTTPSTRSRSSLRSSEQGILLFLL